MDQRFACEICRRFCGNLQNYEAHIRGKEHFRRLAVYVDPRLLPPPLPAQRVMMNDEDSDDDDDEPRARPAVRVAPARMIWDDQPAAAMVLHAPQRTVGLRAPQPAVALRPPQSAAALHPPQQEAVVLRPPQAAVVLHPPQQVAVVLPPPPHPTTSTASPRRWATVNGGYCRRPVAPPEAEKQKVPPSPVSHVAIPPSPPGRTQKPTPMGQPHPASWIPETVSSSSHSSVCTFSHRFPNG